MRALASAAASAGLLALLLGSAGAAPPKVEDSMAQRVQACTGCHGPQGRAASDGYYPRIAGKPAGYLYQQLVGFRDGRRHYALMTQLLQPLSDAYLREIAEHFAGLDIPYPPPQPANAGADVLRRGETLVRRGDPALNLPACAQCHGAALMGVAPAIPALIGMPRDYLNAQLGAWRTGNRHAAAPDCMAAVARRLAPDDISALSQWLAAQPVAPGSKPAAGAGSGPATVSTGASAAAAAAAAASASASASAGAATATAKTSAGAAASAAAAGSVAAAASVSSPPSTGPGASTSVAAVAVVAPSAPTRTSASTATATATAPTSTSAATAAGSSGSVSSPTSTWPGASTSVAALAVVAPSASTRTSASTSTPATPTTAASPFPSPSLAPPMPLPCGSLGPTPGKR